MARECADCTCWLDRYEYSSNQWRKGPGGSRCKSCVSGGFGMTYTCNECNREFSHPNELKMHMQVHRPRNVSCPTCGETRFRSGANAVQHVESGFCSGCRGRDNARAQIYKFVSSQKAMRPFMSSVPQLMNGGDGDNHVPERPYWCPECARSFRQMSQMLQHQNDKHNRNRLIGY